MTLLVRNEEDLLRTNIEYHLSRGVDFIIATDNLSTDTTASILREYEALGVLHYIHESADDYSQDLWVTRMARMASDVYHADWVIHVDADEFWWPGQHSSLKNAFATFHNVIDGVRVARSNFVRLRDTRTDIPFYEAMIVRDLQSVNPLNRPLPGKVAHRAAADVHVSQGNHDFKLGSRRTRIQDTNELIIFHYPLRDYASFERRIAEGGAAYARNQRLPSSVGCTWRRLYELLQQGHLEEYFHEQCVDIDVTNAGISDPRYVLDHRLSNYIKSRIDASVATTWTIIAD